MVDLEAPFLGPLTLGARLLSLHYFAHFFIVSLNASLETDSQEQKTPEPEVRANAVDRELRGGHWEAE